MNGKSTVPANRDEDKQLVLHIRVELGGKIYEENLAAQAHISLDLHGLNEALAAHPGNFAWWAMMEVVAREQLDQLNGELEERNAQLFNFYQSSLVGREEDGKKRSKPTLEAIRSRIVLDKNYQALNKRVLQAKRDQEKITVGRQSMQVKKDTLLAIASNLRQEMDSNLHVVKRDMAEAGRRRHQ